MSNEEILRRAIEKANKNGWLWHYKDQSKFPDIQWMAEFYLIGKNSQFRLIFDHDFAKAFWGENKAVCHTCGTEMLVYEEGSAICIYYYCKHVDMRPNQDLPCTIWEYHLQQMVLEKEPLKYLERWLPREEEDVIIL